MKQLTIGTRIKISEGSGIDSGKHGVIIDKRSIITRNDGIPILEGHYKPVNWRKESAVLLDNGRIITMFNNRLEVAA